MQSSIAAAVPPSLMEELIGLLGDFPSDRSGSQAEVLALRLADLESRARSQGAATETVAAIQGARVLLGLSELLPLPPMAELSSEVR